MKRRLVSVGLLLAVAGVTFVAAFCSARAADDSVMDWPNWRGPQQNCTSTEKGLIESWDPAGGPGSNLIWKNEELGGRSTPIVLRGKLYTIVRDNPGTEVEKEKVVCVDAATGKKIWEHAFNVYLCEVPDTRVGWSCCAADPKTGRIYAQSVSGYFCCLEGDTGKLVWDRSLHEEIGIINTYGGRTNVPIVFEDEVIVNAVIVGWGDTPEFGNLARPAHRFLGLDKATGEIRWLGGTRLSPDDTTYSTPTLTVLGGQAALVFGSGDGQVWAMQPRTGKTLWNFPFSRRGLNVSPLVTPDGRVYISHSEENTFGLTMGSIVALDGTMSGDLTDKEIWREFEIMAGKSSPVMYEDRLYVIDERAKLFIYNASDGKLIAKKALGTSMRSTPVVADGKIYTCTNAGQWYILKPTQSGVEVVHKLRLDGDESDGSPIVSHGRVYLPTSKAIYCLGDPSVKPSADPLPTPPRETPIEQDQVVAQVQVVPYDTLLAPGKTQDYRVRVFNSRGQLLREIPAGEVQFSVKGPGTVSGSGEYTAPGDNQHQVALVVAKVGELTGTGRVRVVPPLPWSFDFNKDADVPLTWVGGRVRYVLRDQDGERFAVKKDLLPTPVNPKNKLGTRSQLSMGPIDLSDYTIQADFAADQKDGKMPDYGLTNSRYSLSVRSQNGDLRLYSWNPSDHRKFASVKFQPEPHKWYTMKMRVDIQGEGPKGDTALIRGKLWPRGEKEPDSWTIEMVDNAPNLMGSPGLFGKTEVAEFFVDNIQVYANQ